MEKRIEELFGKLTLEEKVALMSGVDFWHTAAIERLGIPPIKVTDGPHGARTMSDAAAGETLPATSFPTASALAATWNPDLIEKVGQALGEETRARGCSVLLGPCVNIHRHPLGGRNFESYSEDPYLSSRMTVAYVKGVQKNGTAVSVKHFALNNQEFERMSISSEIDERAMREIYFPSFEKAVKEAGAWTLMCSYNRINGTHASGNRWLLTDILRKEWGFDGLVMSDWFAVHSTAPCAVSGLDLEMPGPSLHFGEKLIEAVKNGEIPESAIDACVRHVLELLVKTGAFDNPAVMTDIGSSATAHSALARQAAAEAAVLLKNDGNVLPLDVRKLSSVAVIGPTAAVAAIQGGGSAQVTPYYSVAPLDALRKALPSSIDILYEQGCPNNVRTPVLAPGLLSSGSNAGLKAEYFNNNDIAGKPALEKIETDFNLRWFGEPPVPGDDFSARWTGIFTAPETGTYTFGLSIAGMANVVLDGKTVCTTADTPMAPDAFIVTECTGTVELEAGKSYPFAADYRPRPGTTTGMRSIRIGCALPQPADMLERAAAAAARADIALVFAGLTAEYESEGFDRASFNLPPSQEELIRKVAAANQKTVVVLNNGSPLGMSGWIAAVPAVLEAWFFGQEGGNAVADILLGHVNPSGRLPDTFPARLEDTPAFLDYPGANGKVAYSEGIFTGYRYYDARKIAPLFPFGHGLSYTTFGYASLKIAPGTVKSGQEVTVAIDITNTGNRAGHEVVQLYVRDIESRLKRPPRELKSFSRVFLEPGQTRTVAFTLDEEAFSYWDPSVPGWVAEAGQFEVQVGASSRDIRAAGFFTLE